MYLHRVKNSSFSRQWLRKETECERDYCAEQGYKLNYLLFALFIRASIMIFLACRH